jgi:hypothetical protein
MFSRLNVIIAIGRAPSSELKEGEYFPLGDFTEVFCPSCSKYIGFIQHGSGSETQ